MQLRKLTIADREEVQSIWRTLFDDSPSFTDWFFTHRYSPDTSVCLTVDGRIASVIQGFPMRVRIRSAAVAAMMICGVSTLEPYRRRGYMHALMQQMLLLCRREGVCIVLHRPVAFSTYRAFGQFPCTRTLRVVSASGTDAPDWQSRPDVAALTDCYRAATARYSGCVIRNESDMLLKTEDYRADGAQYLTTWSGERLDGYAAVFPDGDTGHAEEVLARDPASYRRLVDMLPRGYTAKLPPDTGLPGTVHDQNAMGIADVSMLLNCVVHDPAFTVRVTDGIENENCGTFDGTGRRTDRPPQMTLTAGALMQGLAGYHALCELPEETCFCVDEY